MLLTRFLLTKKMTQECLLGADFLKNCVVDLGNQKLLVRGQLIPPLEETTQELGSCPVSIAEPTVVPGCVICYSTERISSWWLHWSH